MPTITDSRTTFLSRNYSDDATVTASSEDSSFPVSNLKTEPRRQSWRTTGTTGQYLTLDMGAVKVFNAICLVNHNFSQAAEYNIYGHASNIFPSGTASASFKLENQPIYPACIGAGEYYCGWSGAGGVPSSEQLTLMGRTILDTFDQSEYRYWHITFTDSQISDSYIEIGRLVFGYAFQPQINMDWGHDFEIVDPSKIQVTKGGGVVTDTGIIYRRKKSTFSFLSDSEKYFDFYDLIRTIGKSGNFVICYFPQEQEAGRYFETFYGKIEKFTPIRQTALDTNKFTITFRELV